MQMIVLDLSNMLIKTADWFFNDSRWPKQEKNEGIDVKLAKLLHICPVIRLIDWGSRYAAAAVNKGAITRCRLPVLFASWVTQ